MDSPNVLNFETGMLEKYELLIERKASDMIGFFYNEKELQKLLIEANPVIYRVYEVPYTGKGALSYAITVLEPGKIGNEYYMTKGHFHKKEAAELYVTLRGTGLLLMEDKQDNTKVMNMRRGTVIYVEPGFGHRAINTGTNKLIFLALYESDAGHEYGIIKDRGFSYIVLDENGPKLVKNPKHILKKE